MSMLMLRTSDLRCLTRLTAQHRNVEMKDAQGKFEWHVYAIDHERPFGGTWVLEACVSMLWREQGA
jgi:hypothetical protein